MHTTGTRAGDTIRIIEPLSAAPHRDWVHWVPAVVWVADERTLRVMYTGGPHEGDFISVARADQGHVWCR